MREKDRSTRKHKKSKKKHKKKHDSSDSHSSDDNLQWVEASPSYKKTEVKKKKKKKHKYSDSSSSSSESSSHNYSKHESPVHDTVKEKSSSRQTFLKPESPVHDLATEKRESWMHEESFVPTLSKDEMYLSSRQKRIDSNKEKRDKEEKIHRERELNPHWKNEGSGLPQKTAEVESLSLPSTSVGDGGYSWLKKAYYRIQEQAQREGRSMEEVAVERWGSLQKLTSLIEEAEERMKSHPDFKQSRSRSNEKYEQYNSHRKPHFKNPDTPTEFEKSYDSKFKFMKPSADHKSRKVLNQFKSSKKSNSMKYDELMEKTEYEKPEYLKNKTATSDVQSVRKEMSNKSSIPAWKKPKFSPEERKEVADSVDSKIVPSFPSRDVDKSMDMSNRDIVPVIYSDDDLSKLAAKQLKAEIMGDGALAEKLKRQLEEARKSTEEKGFARQPHKKVQEVILTKDDNRGLARPVQATQDQIEDYKHKKSNKFFDDGSKHSLKQMFEREKLTTSDDHLEMFVEATAHSNDMAEIDYESGHISKKLSKKLSSSREEERDIAKAIQQHQKRTSSLEKCEYCLDQPRMKKYLVVDVGEQVYLCLPSFQTLTEGHCLIVPKAHVPSCLSLDENEWKEINDIKSQLRNFFRSQNKSVIFLEISRNLKYYPHAVIECIPVPSEDGDMAPFYFKKAIQESESEWAHNKKLVDLTNKSLQNSIPKNLPYFHVEFDPRVHAGFAHVIEDEKNFPRNFGKEVVGGMLDIDYNFLYKNKKEDPLKRSQDVATFEKSWREFKNVD